MTVTGFLMRDFRERNAGLAVASVPMIGSLKQIGVAAAASLMIAALGSLTWVPLLVANSLFFSWIPWSAPVEGIALLLIWLYLNGRWWPGSTSIGRRDLLRARLVPQRVFAWSAVAGALALASLVGLWIVLVRLTGTGGNPTLPNAGATHRW